MTRQRSHEHRTGLDETSAAATLATAFEAALADGISTPDLDGTATTSSFTETMLKHITATGA